MMMMEDIAFSDWPVDLAGSNHPWLPAYGFQPPHTLLDKEDFLGNPDAELFLHGTQSYAYLETIQEETSDDLRSDSDVSESRESPVGWLATDSESGSVIRIQTIDDVDCESDRETACPAKRRRHEQYHPPSDDDSSQSLSRSSSLLQFENLEKQCQEISTSSPSIFSGFSYDSLEHTRGDVSPDSLEESDYYKTLKIDTKMIKKCYNSDDSGDSEETLASGSVKAWRSVDGGLQIKKMSTENLSEDSGYGDNSFCRSSSIPNMVVVQQGYRTRVHIGAAFGAYDGGLRGGFCGNFGVSYHDLSAAVEADRLRCSNNAKRRRADVVNIDGAECVAKFSDAASASEPNLLNSTDAADECESQPDNLVCVSSVPKDLNLAGLVEPKDSIASKNWDLGDCLCGDEMPKKVQRYYRTNDKITIRLKYDTSSLSSEDVDCASFKREGSYLEAMTNAVDSDCEKLVANGQMLKAISEQSVETTVQSVNVCAQKTNRNVVSTPNLAEIDQPRKSSLINRSTSTSAVSDAEDRTLRNFGGSTGSKGVHFCPVVSEVNWRDEITSTDERESSYSVSSTPEREVVRLEARKPPPPKRISQSQPELLQRRVKLLEDSSDESDFTTPIARPKKKPAEARPTSHVPTVNPLRAYNNNNKQPVNAMASHEAHVKPPKKKLGGFFSRIASFRFSNKKKSDDTPNKKQNQQQQPPVVVGQRLATKDDYIYIPLKGPPMDNNNVDDGGGCISGKPPLPKVPPRVVGACVKRRPEAAARAAAATTELRGTIDSGPPRRPMEEPMGLIETDLDTEVTVITANKTRSLMNLGVQHHAAHPTAAASIALAPAPGCRPHKSMEFLLDKQNLKVVEPPENELQKGGERVMSEHQLRVQRSLQKLNVPDWYTKAQVPREGFLLKKASSSASRECRWQGTGSKTTSLSSLGSATQSPVILSPTTLHAQPFVRWSTSKLNSTASSPCASTRSSFNARQPNGSISPSSLRSSFNYRQPYLGWRSQERLSRPRTPAERLANSLLTHTPHQQQESPEIQTSIKEVTSAIVHYVSALRPEDAAREHSYDSQETASQRSRSVSPRGSQKLCWLESSFVGTRPLDTPQTPLTLTESPAGTPTPNTLRLDLQTHNDVSVLTTGGSRKPSPSSTTLEDVLDSLLGLPSSTRAPSPSLQETASASTSPVHLEGAADEQFRRRSEGSEPTFDSHHVPLVLRCRYSRCGKTATADSVEGAAYKSCHNCSYMYCSRTCRRSHWEKHRRTCLFSRVGSLCRQVIAAAKRQEDTLKRLSVIARRGYLARGAGAVKIFFPRPDEAEKFLSDGLGSLGEPTYVRWTDLLPSEMGPQLYAELVKMCQGYNPDCKLVLYVSVCVVSEAPAAGAVKWERQLVSRCGKMRLSKNIHVPDRDENPETLILTSSPTAELRLRETVLEGIQTHLQHRGVCLERSYPDVHQQLCDYAAGGKFTPVTVYPTDCATGKAFMCIVMPDAQPQCIEKVVNAAGVCVRTVDVLRDKLDPV